MASSYSDNPPDANSVMEENGYDPELQEELQQDLLLQSLLTPEAHLQQFHELAPGKYVCFSVGQSSEVHPLDVNCSLSIAEPHIFVFFVEYLTKHTQDYKTAIIKLLNPQLQRLGKQLFIADFSTLQPGFLVLDRNDLIHQVPIFKLRFLALNEDKAPLLDYFQQDDFLPYSQQDFEQGLDSSLISLDESPIPFDFNEERVGDKDKQTEAKLSQNPRDTNKDNKDLGRSNTSRASSPLNVEKGKSLLANLARVFTSGTKSKDQIPTKLGPAEPTTKPFDWDSLGAKPKDQAQAELGSVGPELGNSKECQITNSPTSQDISSNQPLIKDINEQQTQCMELIEQFSEANPSKEHLNQLFIRLCRITESLVQYKDSVILLASDVNNRQTNRQTTQDNMASQLQLILQKFDLLLGDNPSNVETNHNLESSYQTANVNKHNKERKSVHFNSFVNGQSNLPLKSILSKSRYADNLNTPSTEHYHGQAFADTISTSGTHNSEGAEVGDINSRHHLGSHLNEIRNAGTGSHNRGHQFRDSDPHLNSKSSSGQQYSHYGGRPSSGSQGTNHFHQSRCRANGGHSTHNTFSNTEETSSRDQHSETEDDVNDDYTTRDSENTHQFHNDNNFQDQSSQNIITDLFKGILDPELYLFSNISPPKLKLLRKMRICESEAGRLHTEISILKDEAEALVSPSNENLKTISQYALSVDNLVNNVENLQNCMTDLKGVLSGWEINTLIVRLNNIISLRDKTKVLISTVKGLSLPKLGFSNDTKSILAYKFTGCHLTQFDSTGGLYTSLKNFKRAAIGFGCFESPIAFQKMIDGYKTNNELEVSRILQSKNVVNCKTFEQGLVNAHGRPSQIEVILISECTKLYQTHTVPKHLADLEFQLANVKRRNSIFTQLHDAVSYIRCPSNQLNPNLFNLDSYLLSMRFFERIHPSYSVQSKDEISDFFSSSKPTIESLIDFIYEIHNKELNRLLSFNSSLRFTLTEKQNNSGEKDKHGGKNKAFSTVKPPGKPTSNPPPPKPATSTGGSGAAATGSPRPDVTSPSNVVYNTNLENYHLSPEGSGSAPSLPPGKKGSPQYISVNVLNTLKAIFPAESEYKLRKVGALFSSPNGCAVCLHKLSNFTLDINSVLPHPIFRDYTRAFVSSCVYALKDTEELIND